MGTRTLRGRALMGRICADFFEGERGLNWFNGLGTDFFWVTCLVADRCGIFGWR